LDPFAPLNEAGVANLNCALATDGTQANGAIAGEETTILISFLHHGAFD